MEFSYIFVCGANLILIFLVRQKLISVLDTGFVCAHSRTLILVNNRDISIEINGEIE